MSESALRQIWGALCLVLLYYSVNSWLVTIGAKPILDVNMLHEDRSAAALLGIVVCAPLLCLASWVGRTYAIRHGGKTWPERIPVAWPKGVDRASRDGRTYQGIVLATVVGVPVAALLHLYRKTVNSGVVNCDTGADVGHWIFDLTLDHKYCLGSQDGVTYFPFVAPLVLACLILAALATTTAYVAAVLQR